MRKEFGRGRRRRGRGKAEVGRDEKADFRSREEGGGDGGEGRGGEMRGEEEKEAGRERWSLREKAA